MRTLKDQLNELIFAEIVLFFFVFEGSLLRYRYMVLFFLKPLSITKQVTDILRCVT